MEKNHSNGNVDNEDGYNYPQISYYEPIMDGEWKTRKITIMGVVRSFVSQLRPGQDLTRVSLPAVLLHPFSLLEVMGSRELNAVETLLPINSESDPLNRFLCVLRWYLSTIQHETFHKKPYNPVIGETHEVSITTEKYGKTEYVSEQVSHHPPISALYVYNPQEKVLLTVNLSFGVKFGGNSASIVTDGSASIMVENIKEEYEIPKRTPDMQVQNIIWGTKRIYWSGEVTISCAKTGYSATLNFKESGGDNIVKGNIVFSNDSYLETEVYTVEGKCGGVIYLKHEGVKKVLLDCETLVKPHINYKPRAELEPLASLSVWKDVNRYIIGNEVDKADEIKKKVEAEQRNRTASKRAAGIENQAKYFTRAESAWIPKKMDETNKDKDKDKEKDPSNTNLNSKKSKSDSILQPSVSQTKIKRRSMSYDSDSDSDSSEDYEYDLREREKDREREKERENNNNISSSQEIKSVRSPQSQIHSHNQTQHTLQIPTQSASGSGSNTPVVQVNSALLSSSPKDRREEKDNFLTTSTSKENLSKEIGKRGSRLVVLPKREDSKENMTDKKKRASSSLSGSEPLVKTLSTTSTADNEHNIMKGWMKMRNSMKLWINRWFVLRPGKLIYYKDDKDMLRDRCAGIIRLADCEVKYRPTNKDGFSFKLYHLLHYPIYHKYGLRGETIKTALLPVSSNYCILRVLSEQERRSWMEAITAQIEYANSFDRPKEPIPMAMSFDSDEDDINHVHAGILKDEKLGIINHVLSDENGNGSELEDPFFQTQISNKGFQKNLMEGLNLQQKNNSKSLQKKTLKIIEEWKKELDVKIVNMERRVIASTKQNIPQSTKGKITLSVPQLLIFILLCILIGRYIPLPLPLPNSINPF